MILQIRPPGSYFTIQSLPINMTISLCVGKSMLSSLNVMRHLFANNKIPDIFKMWSLVSLFYAFNVTRDDLLNLVQISINKETLSINILCLQANLIFFFHQNRKLMFIWKIATREFAHLGSCHWGSSCPGKILLGTLKTN